jgi:hypothetical protein
MTEEEFMDKYEDKYEFVRNRHGTVMAIVVSQDLHQTSMGLHGFKSVLKRLWEILNP